MLIPEFLTRYYPSPKGVIHIGAHQCEERDIYARAGLTDESVLWIEANPSCIEQVRRMYPSSLQIVQALIADTDDDFVTFHITNNVQSSSFLPLAKHREYHPHVHETNRLTMKTTRLPTLLEQHSINVSKYDVLVMDIQGAELHALRGMESILNYFQVIYLEVNEEEIYQGNGLLTDVADFLRKHGFYLAEKQMTEYHWGDAVFTRQTQNLS